MGDARVGRALQPATPTFLVIGAAKCGTTALHHYLRQHPEICVPQRKEPSYFAAEFLLRDGSDGRSHPETGVWPRYWVTSWDAYLHLFDHCGGKAVMGEVSPAYMSVPGTAEIIAEKIPDVRLVALLRNPVDRAYSHWLMKDRVTRAPSSLPDFLDEHERRLRQGMPTILNQGLYYRALLPYFRLFGRSSIHVMLSEDLSTDPANSLSQLFAFLGASPDHRPDPPRFDNSGGVARNTLLRTVLHAERKLAYALPGGVPAAMKSLNSRLLTTRRAMPPLAKEHRHRLQLLYQDDVTALQQLIGSDLGGWLPS